MSNTYKAAMAVLTEQDTRRIICVYFHTKDGVTDWGKATAEYGSASVESMKKVMSNIQKKVEKGIGNEEGNIPAAATPTSKKRKAKAPADGSEDTGQTPVPKKRGRPSKKSKVAVDSEPAINVESAVKEEEEEEED
ncbi:hypothetical protein K431DRAFT_286543 [Polychaeton citri CBS 116435]|uniref:Uncharacterized protein n=1 Tax=Polychaeton citri CBS 116435 TaxID=1314669 RepID=A0A9P4Q4X6_9PEZI|nr:hypothetical protein K431DRAFT_286543 [Polychaeton citri CBS 116435]